MSIECESGRCFLVELIEGCSCHFALVRLYMAARTNASTATALARTKVPHTTHFLCPPQLLAMLDVEDFDAVFQGLNYTDGLVHQIQENQHSLGGQTYFERLLELLKIKGMCV